MKNAKSPAVKNGQPKLLLISPDDNFDPDISTILSENNYMLQYALDSHDVDLMRQMLEADFFDAILIDLSSDSAFMICYDLMQDCSENETPVVLVGEDLTHEQGVRGLKTGADLCLNYTEKNAEIIIKRLNQQINLRQAPQHQTRMSLQ